MTHSKFKIPINVDNHLTCEIKKGTQLARLINSTSLIVWNEAPINHRNYFEVLDLSSKDVLEIEKSSFNEKPFGGKLFLSGGYYRQILLVVIERSRADTIDVSISQSYEWRFYKIYTPERNILLLNDNVDEEHRKLLINSSI